MALQLPDGHNWRKKKDGKTVKEAHERLKAGSVDVLHCYYAHGEENENFQRRSYRLLEDHDDHAMPLSLEWCERGLVRVGVTCVVHLWRQESTVDMEINLTHFARVGEGLACGATSIAEEDFAAVGRR
ncbi:Calmodulin-binding transcription activator 3 [Camellia lanceoleosa]|uniref:Calmodulin-binding transcription activator 3 n=1 Tax=Camellia lanceoleosa TaxID=1840588 RepID=A0ACC0G8M9_9ERIC|nr:Calmodulin-binding transcription activator 3 [Camellia lanceoleosa]